MNAAAIILEVRNLQVKKGPTLVLDIPKLAIEEGEILALIGPNGAGKTTLLQALARLQKISQGEMFFKGKKVSSNHPEFEYRRRLAMVFQDPLLFDTTVFKNVASGLKMRGIDGEALTIRVEENLDRFGIAHLAQRSARKISGGEAQRVSLARAFALVPEMILLDEPFSSLDPPTREALIEDLDQILRQTRTTAIFTTHDRMEALRLSDRMAVMNEGRILQIGPPNEVSNQPASQFVASFVGVETILHGRVVGKRDGILVVSTPGRQIEAAADLEVGADVSLAIRPENVTLSVHPAREPSSARNALSARIVKIVPMGLYFRIHLDCGFPLVALVTGHSVENLSLEAGKEVIASFKATSIHVMKRTAKFT